MRLLALAFALILAGCNVSVTENAAGPREVAPVLTGADAVDTRSYARPQVARVTHVALELDADFEAKRMAGTATLDLQAADGAQRDHPRFQGARDRRRDRRGRQCRCPTSSAPAIRRRARR